MNERLKQLLVDASKPENRMNFITYGKLTNEKLIEFAIQAGLHPTYIEHSAYSENSLTGLLNKFAELIVRECIDTISDCSVEYCTRPQIVSEIKEHFGVEK